MQDRTKELTGGSDRLVVDIGELDLAEARARDIVVRQQAVIAKRQEFVATFDEFVSWPGGFSLGDLSVGGER